MLIWPWTDIQTISISSEITFLSLLLPRKKKIQSKIKSLEYYSIVRGYMIVCRHSKEFSVIYLSSYFFFCYWHWTDDLIRDNFFVSLTTEKEKDPIKNKIARVLQHCTSVHDFCFFFFSIIHIYENVRILR